MAEQSGFFRSVSGDRKYTVDFLALWVASFIGNGVYDGELAVTAGDHMQVIVPAGRAWINGYYYRNDGPFALPVANADGVLNRKDAVVLRWDVNERSITARVLTGTPASSPKAPGIVRTVEQYDLKLAEISVPAGTTAITGALIADTRLDASVCGIVHGVVQQADTTVLYNQIQADLAQFKTENEADFSAWLQSIRDALDGDTAGHLQNQIDAIDAALEGKSDKSTVQELTLPASDWTGSDVPYSQTVAVEVVTATSANEILPGGDIAADQLEALQAANIQDGGQTAGVITLLAYGDKPTIDLPVRIIVRGDL